MRTISIMITIFCGLIYHETYGVNVSEIGRHRWIKGSKDGERKDWGQSVVYVYGSAPVPITDSGCELTVSSHSTNNWISLFNGGLAMQYLLLDHRSGKFFECAIQPGHQHLVEAEGFEILVRKLNRSAK
ncbi:hypothetical protein PGTUg99_002498 [Puccinia graminis f. sp. tritici]|uniref:Uncharacterized protein n=1 Tax=Puccinia graminis f. sp. tritici TaxID=56615 RepID=A0A5B0RRM7_PUCGR|nr:hypothetical protein PGTUg99_002498 [Puccinia graminis f. sp. tritici]